MSAEGRFPMRPLLLVLAYLPLLGLATLGLTREREARWHARNGLALFMALVAVGVASTLVSVLLPSLSCLYPVAMLAAGVVYVAIDVLAIVKALEGQRLMIPGISAYASRLSAADGR